ncbi:MAG: alpha/beta hydrolase-fold protein [Bacteroidota bacterium]
MIGKTFFSIMLLLSSCGVSKSDFDILKKENGFLKQELADLQAKNEALAYLTNHSKVVISNSDVKEILSKYTGQKYKIKVKFPRDYAQTDSKYPVLYILDAETNFGGVSYIVQRLIKDKLIPPILLVGVAYGTDYRSFYKLRSRDLTPTEDTKLRMGGAKPDPTGGAEHFISFMNDELFPFIEDNYRIKKGERAIYGHSYGGLFGSYVFLKQPHLFNKYLLLSPSLWYDKNLLLDEVKTFDNQLVPTNLYMASGELEGRIDDLQIKFMNSLKERNSKNLNLKSEVMEDETHRTIFGAGFTNGLRFLYAK